VSVEPDEYSDFIDPVKLLVPGRRATVTDAAAREPEALQMRPHYEGIGYSRAQFEVALGEILAAIPAPHAAFDSVDDVLVAANPAFIEEFSDRPVSRRNFELSFELVAAANERRDTVAEDVRPRSDRREVFCRRTGRWYVFHWSALSIPSGGSFTLLSVTNLTEKMDGVRQNRALQEQLLGSSRVMSVGEMTTTLAHEINQPLAAIINCLTAARTLLRRPDDQATRLRQTLQLAHEQAEQAAAVVARIREFVRSREPRRERLCVQTIVDRVVQLQQLDAQKHRVTLHVLANPELPEVLVDRLMIEQVLTNLVRNAIEAMQTTHPAERSVTISARSDLDGHVEVRVADRGPGITLAEEAQLFRLFFTTKPNGMGIGLAVCRSIIEFHQGHLYFERGPGRGSVFVFTLPAAPPT
jgi:signal transduction histidine kinase